MVKFVIDFYESDVNTYILPDKNDCISIRNEDGVKTKKQKCLLLCTLKELYELFKKEHVTESIGFSTFAKLRSKNCVFAGSSGTHSVCVCSIHQNVMLLITGNIIKNCFHCVCYNLFHLIYNIINICRL